MAKVQDSIVAKLQQELHPTHLEVVNESHQHNVPAQSETHFKVIVVAESFEGLNRIQRQRTIHRILAAELEGPVHALTQRALTPQEWQEQTANFESPPCHGGSAREKAKTQGDT